MKSKNSKKKRGGGGREKGKREKGENSKGGERENVPTKVLSFLTSQEGRAIPTDIA